ncbi:MAG TPA: homogentisate phytyltransferase, partial [Bacteroidia bacterium]
MSSLKSVWKFSRPHTIIGSVVSIITLYVMSNGDWQSAHLLLLLKALVTGITCNLYIVGINQIVDVELDKINKPFLPLASGEMTISTARVIVYSCFTIASLLAASISLELFLVVTSSMAIGWAYSCPPLSLRRHHLPAALSISIVRGLMVNLGAYRVFNSEMNGSYDLSGDILVLTLFIVTFSIVIAWFKDLPDVIGDRQFKIKSIAVLYSPIVAIRAGQLILSTAYSLSFIYYFLDDSYNMVLAIGHILLFVLFQVNMWKV